MLTDKEAAVNLCCALAADTMADFRKGGRRRDEAWNYFKSDICRALMEMCGVEPEYVYRKLREIEKEDTAVRCRVCGREINTKIYRRFCGNKCRDVWRMKNREVHERIDRGIDLTDEDQEWRY